MRAPATFELRAQGGGSTLTLEGYASVYDTEYEVAGGPPWGWIESIDQGAGAESLAEDPDVLLLVNHEGLPLARTRSGTLRLSEDSTGLAIEADLHAEDPDVAQVRSKIERGDVDEMSFAFRVSGDGQDWDDDYERRWIRAYNINRGDVSIVSFGANAETSVDLRSPAAIARALSDDPDMLARALHEASRGLEPERAVAWLTRAREVAAAELEVLEGSAGGAEVVELDEVRAGRARVLLELAHDL